MEKVAATVCVVDNYVLPFTPPLADKDIECTMSIKQHAPAEEEILRCVNDF